MRTYVKYEVVILDNENNTFFSGEESKFENALQDVLHAIQKYGDCTNTCSITKNTYDSDTSIMVAQKLMFFHQKEC